MSGRVPGRSTCSDWLGGQRQLRQRERGIDWARKPFDIIVCPRTPAGQSDVPLGALLKFLRMKPGHGEVLLTEGDPRVRDDEERLVEEFRRQLDDGMWAAVPVTAAGDGRREARMVQDYTEIPAEADRVIFFPRAAGG